jgi:hypothetical protein
VGIHPDRHLHAGLLSPPTYDGGRRRTYRRRGRPSLLSSHFRQARSRPEGRSFSRSAASGHTATCRFGVTSGRVPDTLPQRQVPPVDFIRLSLRNETDIPLSSVSGIASECVFCSLVARPKPSRRVMENDRAVAFLDINPPPTVSSSRTRPSNEGGADRSRAPSRPRGR